MADDNGLVADLENGIVTALTAITLGGKTVFRSVDNWHFQIKSGDSFRRFNPFAYVEYEGSTRANWEGDHDLLQRMVFSIRVGTTITGNVEDGAARIGTGTDVRKKQLGISRLRDLVITALQNVRIATTDDQNEYCEYIGDDVVWAMPNQSAILMKFSIDRIE